MAYCQHRHDCLTPARSHLHLAFAVQPLHLLFAKTTGMISQQALSAGVGWDEEEVTAAANKGG